MAALVCRNVKENRYSFHDQREVKMTKLDNTGIDNGSMNKTKKRKLEQPSILVDSSISMGISLKKLISRYEAKGITNVPNTKTTLRRLLISPRLRI